MASGDQSAKFTSGNLMRHVAVMSFTGSIGLMAIFIVDFVDLIFIGMLGNSALAAAVGFAGTLLFIGNSVSIGLSIAAGVLVSRALGAKDQDRARQSATNVAIISFLLSVVLSVFMIIFMDPALALIGAQGETLELSRIYLWVLLPSTAFMSLAFVGNAILRAYGDAKRAMYATLFGGIANAICDPIFIFVFDWGLAGAAWASTVARLTILFFSIAPIFKIYQGFDRPNPAHFRSDIRDISSLAIPAVLTNIATPIGSGIFTRALSAFGDDAVAASAVIGRLTPVAFSVVFALSGAVGPIIGQNAGAGLYDRVRGTYRDAIAFAGIYILIVSALLFIGRGFIADLFNATGEARDLIYLFCGPLALLYIFMAVIFVANASFNNLRHPYYSTWVNWGRNTLGMLPFVYVGGLYWGAAGVLVGANLGAVVFALIAHILAMRVMNKEVEMHGRDDFALHQRDHVLINRTRR